MLTGQGSLNNASTITIDFSKIEVDGMFKGCGGITSMSSLNTEFWSQNIILKNWSMDYLQYRLSNLFTKIELWSEAVAITKGAKRSHSKGLTTGGTEMTWITSGAFHFSSMGLKTLVYMPKAASMALLVHGQVLMKRILIFWRVIFYYFFLSLFLSLSLLIRAVTDWITESERKRTHCSGDALKTQWTHRFKIMRPQW